MVALAIHTGIAPSVWAEEGTRAIATAFDLLEDERQASRDAQRDVERGRGGGND